MNLSRFYFRRLVAITMASVAFWIQHAGAQTPPATPGSEIKIVSGKIIGASKAGQPVPATLSNVVDILREYYREASITVVGVDDVLIDNVTLRIAPRTAYRGSALRIALAALAEASGRKFRVQDFSDQDFMLSADRSPTGRRTAEVFNLGHLLSNHQGKHLDRQIRDTETALTAVRKVMTNDHPRVADMTTQLEILKAHKAQAAPPLDSKKVIEQIMDTVAVTLGLLKSGEKQPEFQFHPGTNLLIVVGGDDAIEVTRKVVAALEKEAN
jgi:hypothetical protein